jgi:4-amino-4-deoxy-L-arabinose transferase-like glycosyltransferase
MLENFLKRSSSVYHIIALIAISGLFYLPFLGATHLFDWDEVNFAESSREMLVTGDFFRVTVAYQPFWEKPPLFFWLQSFSMSLLGVGEYAARLPNAIFGILTIVTIYLIGKRQVNKQFGFIWSLVFIGSILPSLYFKSGIIDPVFNYFIFCSVYFAYRGLFENESKIINALIVGLFSGLGVLTKGPVALLLLLLSLVVIMVFKRFKVYPQWQQVLSFALVFLTVTFVWYGLETIKNGPWFVVEFIEYQIDLFRRPVAGHSQPFYYHFVIVLLGCFPFSIFAISSFRKSHPGSSDFRFTMKTLFWVVLILFSISTTKIAHYSSMCYLPLSFIAADFLWLCLKGEIELKGWIRHVYLGFGLLLSVLLIGIPVFFMTKDSWIDLVKGDFLKACFSVPDVFTGWDVIIGLIFGVLVFVIWSMLRKGDLYRVVLLNAVAYLFFINMGLYLLVPKIETYTQAPLINMSKSLQGKDAYVSATFKTYATFFYARIKPYDFGQRKHLGGWLTYYEDQKVVYVFNRVGQDDLKDKPEFKLISTEGGYELYRVDRRE